MIGAHCQETHYESEAKGFVPCSQSAVKTRLINSKWTGFHYLVHVCAKHNAEIDQAMKQQ